jgi:hypothetical protein
MWSLPVLQVIPLDDLIDVGVLAEPEFSLWQRVRMSLEVELA